MSRQHNLTNDFPVIVGFIVLVTILVCAQVYLVSFSRQPESSVIIGDMVTHYVGNAAFELPDSWAMDSIQAAFYLADKKNGSQILFKETPAKAGQDAAEELANRLKSRTTLNKSNDLRKASFGQTDINEALGRPAMIHIREARPNSFGLSVVSAYTYSPPPGDRLEISLELATPQANLLFTYIESMNWPSNKEILEIVVDKQHILTDWALAFISHFQYSGYNSPQSSGFLATKFGRIDIRKKPEYQHYVLTSRFSQNTNSITVSNISFSLSSLPTEAPSCGSDTGTRKPAKPFGCEVRKITTKPNTEQLDLSWQNCSTNRQFGLRGPSFSIAYCGYAVDQDVLDEAEILTMWDNLINSIRILPDSN